jgi:hypothetical protein
MEIEFRNQNLTAMRAGISYPWAERRNEFLLENIPEFISS